MRPETTTSPAPLPEGGLRIPKTQTRQELRAALAKECHDQWSGWMRYLFNKCGPPNADGTMTMPAWTVERWHRQHVTPYEELSVEEQQSDLEEADKFLKILEENVSLPEGVLT